MRLATSTNLISFNRDGSKTEMRSLLTQYAEAGFTVLDLNFCEMLNPQSLLFSDEDGQYSATLQLLQQQHQLLFNQAHAPYLQDGTLAEALLARSFSLCKLLGIPILVVHPIWGSVADNMQAFGDWVKRAEEQRLILAFENLNGEQEITDIDVLCDLVDSFHSAFAKVCYDTGHAHMCGHELGRDILRLGDRLVATHIADNRGREDEHLLPFYGTIDWDAVVAALQTIGYTGDLTLECMFFTHHLPRALKSEALRHAKVVGTYLLSRVP